MKVQIETNQLTMKNNQNSKQNEIPEEVRRTEIAMLKLLAKKYPAEAKKFAGLSELTQIRDNLKSHQESLLTKKFV
jgi:hypothetical protein